MIEQAIQQGHYLTALIFILLGFIGYLLKKEEKRETREFQREARINSVVENNTKALSYVLQVVSKCKRTE